MTGITLVLLFLAFPLYDTEEQVVNGELIYVCLFFLLTRGVDFTALGMTNTSHCLALFVSVIG